MSDETGLAAALWAVSKQVIAPDLMVPLADAALAWVDARLTDPATVEAVAGAIHREVHQGWPCRGDQCWEVDKAADWATAALAVVRGLLGGTGGETP